MSAWGSQVWGYVGFRVCVLCFCVELGWVCDFGAVWFWLSEFGATYGLGCWAQMVGIWEFGFGAFWVRLQDATVQGLWFWDMVVVVSLSGRQGFGVVCLGAGAWLASLAAGTTPMPCL